MMRWVAGLDQSRGAMAAAVTCGALALSLTACGSSKSGSDATAASDGGGTATATATPAASKAAAAKLTGEPIVIADVTELTGVPAFNTSILIHGEQAAVQHVNENGGIDGRPLKLTSCDAKFNPGGSLACAQQAVGPKPIAITGIDDFSGSSGADALYQKKGIITMNYPNQPNLLKSTTAFSVAAAGDVLFPGIAYYAGAVKKAKSFAQLQQDTPVGHSFAAGIEQAAKAAGVQKVTTVFFPNTITDFSPKIAELASSHSDAYFGLVNGPQISTVWRGLEQAGVKAGDIYLESAGIAPDTLTSMGSIAKGVNIDAEFLNPYDQSNGDVATYRAAMTKAGYGKEGVGLLAQSGFANVMFLATVAKAVGGKDVTAASVNRYLQKTIGPGAKGSIPVFMGTPMKPAPARTPGVHRAAIQMFQWTGDKFVTVSDWLTPPGNR